MSTRPLLPASSGRASDALEEAQFRARMARVGPDGAHRTPRRNRAPERRRGFRLGWKGWLVVDCLVVLLVVAGVVAWPPVQSCRNQDQTVGFYAGDSVGKCIRRGIADRLDTADQRLKSLIRRSGH
ncbi:MULTISPECIES: hypothetical protein [Methylobacterium]|jgi:hypothetical protein|uniref:hypothetical protein n=1 Tax=Methylobacterium TaxID=407 RepID=UPI00034CC953|nr:MULTISPECIES: hypothetical protein [Methylobacterium]MBN4092676.1 hypothetical protein [Methylobacterium sp. OT2]UIN34872.1 hypothetical protein LXM90_28100 [Methylobacterium oryzae]SEG63408.1 hypothetical protein SAMN04488144_13056 [Methylobacterium sp. 190mf]SEP22304.1 hypothetical protein SAMN02799625_05067 [Methylobacterium sp. UNC300MFChir4.1]SFT24785.1 hypothetical protein SAMN04487845_13066 [Methylobacterium sp. yr668]